MANSNHLVISYMTIRRAIGVLGILLPSILVISSYTTEGCQHIQESISHYYYTKMGDVFVGILCAVGLFLITYKGYKSDRFFTNLAGIFALGIAFFPTSNIEDVLCRLYQLEPSKLKETIHYVSAALFFVTLAYISIFLFTKSTGEKTLEKIYRNRIYRVCGVVMIVSIAMIAVVHFLLSEDFKNSFYHYKPVFWLESLALWAFGISWLVKGEVILADDDKKEK